MKKILVLSYDASSTGAPKFLLTLIRKLKEQENLKVNFLFTNHGPLANEFSLLGKTYFLSFLNDNSKIIFYRVLKRVLPLHKIYNTLLKIKIYLYNPDIVIANTVANFKSLKFIKKDTNLITIVHEMKGVIEILDNSKTNNFQKVINRTDLFIAVSKAVKNDLTEKYNINENKIKLIYNSIPYFKQIKIPNKEIDKWKENLNIPKKAFIVGSCGSLVWRKGPDIFINILKCLKQNFSSENIYFIWLGGSKVSYWLLNLEKEINYLGLNDRIQILSEVKDTSMFYNAIDLYISTAREEPFGLTLLEAGTYKIPCFAFEKSGGPEEILNNETGVIIPYGDYNKASEKIIELKQNAKVFEKYSKAIHKFSEDNLEEDNFSKYQKLINLYSK